MARIAIYFTPDPRSDLWRFGCGVIGYDAVTGEEPAYLSTAGLDAKAWAALTAEPRRYGFHATLKAPFELADGVSIDDAMTAATGLATSLAAIRLARFEVADIGRFIALVPSEPSAALHAIADACVVQLECLRAPLTSTDRARRLASLLTAHQIALLDEYGYPYVLDQFRFHMTLTGPIADAGLRSAVRVALARLYDDAVLPGPIGIDRIAVFHQAAREDRFRLLAALPLSQPPSL